MKSFALRALTFSAILLSATPSFSEENKVDWAAYMRSPAAIAAVGAAVSMASPCPTKLVFEEIVKEATRSISVHCRGNSSEDELSVFVTFDIYGDNLLPRKFDLAG